MSSENFLDIKIPIYILVLASLSQILFAYMYKNRFKKGVNGYLIYKIVIPPFRGIENL